MAEDPPAVSEYKGMWLFVMFDLPMNDNEQRRSYTRFRNELLKDGFTALQYSVYARYCPSEEAAEVHKKRVRCIIPPDGRVRILAITDRQFGKMESYFGKNTLPNEEPPEQLLLF
ncbi:MAG TPA: CRISPR-associated endonuclease Cas2 [Candidatus Hydrogenedentes bacterium]|nr:CRISPR-associated endonuclease Cas2 [Candidatus Hydrogenedentota bacterium]